MAFPRRDLQKDLTHPPHPRQLGLFYQQNVTIGDVEGACDAVSRVLSGPKTIVKATRFPARPGCALGCDCDRLNGDPA